MRTEVVDFFKRYRYQIGVAFILLLAAFMRFYRLDSLPPGLHPDEAANGLDIFRILEHHDFRPFYTTNGGREALFFYLQSIGVMIFGNTTLALRVAPALIGTLAAGATYLWVSSWFGRRNGLIAGFLMAVTPWAVTISRDGFRAGMVALMVPLTLWLFTKAFQTQRAVWYALAGFSLGAGFYTYIAYRLFPVAIVAAIAYAFIWRREQLLSWRRGILVSTAGLLVALIPMGIYGVQHPADLFSRSGGVSFTNSDLNHGKPLQTLADTVVKTALMFNFQGDENYRQNLGGQPEFNIFVGVMFILGLFLCVTNLRSLRYFGVITVFGAMLLPEVLTAEGIPHALRAIGALPPAIALAAIGIGYMLDTWNNVFPLNVAARVTGSAAIVVLLGLSAYQGYVQYFVAWANAPETYHAYAEDMTAWSNYYNQNKFNGKRYAIGGYSLQAIEYLTHNKSSYEVVDPRKVDSVPLEPGVAKEFAMSENDKAEALKRLKLKFPKGRVSPHYSNFSGEELFVVYTVPAS